VSSLRGDGGYDKEKVREVAYEKHLQPIIPPQRNAVIDKDAKEWMQQRDETIVRLKEISRKDWKIEMGTINEVWHKPSCSGIKPFTAQN
jgi:hypothetical protein